MSLSSIKVNNTQLNWDDEPTAGSENLVKSGGVEKELNTIKGYTGIYTETEDFVAKTKISGVYWKTLSQQASESQMCTLKYPIDDNKEYYITGKWYANVLTCITYVFIGNNNTVLGGGPAHTFDTEYIVNNQRLSIPEGTIELNISTRNLETQIASFTLKSVLSEYTPIYSQELQEEIDDIKNDIDGIENDVDGIKDIVGGKIRYENVEPTDSKNNFRLSSNAITTSSGEGRKIESFLVNPGEEYKIKIVKHSGNQYSRLIAVNSREDALIETGVSVTPYNYAAPVNEETEYEVVIGEGMYSLYVCSDKDYPITVSKKKIIKTVDERIGNVEERVDTIEQELEELPIESVDVILPENIDVVAGDTLMLYYRNIVRVPNIDNYYIIASCDKAEYQQRCVMIKTNSSMIGESYPLSIEVINKDSKVIGNGQTTIRVISVLSNPVSMKNILLVGSSFFTSGTVTNELIRRFTLTSGTVGNRSNPKGIGLTNISFVGRTYGFAYTNAYQEAVGGATFYTRYGQNISPKVRFNVTNVNSCSIGAVYKDSGNHNYTVVDPNFESGGDGNILCNEGTTPSATSGYLTRVSGEGDDTIEYTSYIVESGNPFWNTETNQLDFTSYANEYCDGHIDVMATMLTGIGLSNKTMDNLFEEMIKPFVRQLHIEFPNCKFIHCINAQPSTKGGGNTRYSRHVRSCDYAERAYAMMKDPEFESYVSVAHTMQTFDSDNMYPIKQVLVANRVNKTEDYCSNFVHPTGTGGQFRIGDDEGGCLCFADAIYSQISKVLQE